MLSPQSPDKKSDSVSLRTIQKAELGSGLGWWHTTTFKIYLGHSLSSWGDRMWSFAVGLYMVILFPESLMLTAIYGFSNCLSGIIFGAYIGSWIDKTERLQAAKASLVLQNTAVFVGASLLALTLHFRSAIYSVWDGKLEYMLFAMMILLAIIAELASMASKIILEKDWIVVLAAGDEKQLSKLNATMRTINLTTSILAPIVVGQIVYYGSQIAGAIFIACWNCLSALIEYNLLCVIYRMVPQLRSKLPGTRTTTPIKSNGGGRPGHDIPFVTINTPDSDNSTGRSPPSQPRLGSLNDNKNQTVPNGSSFSSPPETGTKGQEIRRASLIVNHDGYLRSANNNGLLRTPGNDFEDISLVTPISDLKKVYPEQTNSRRSSSLPAGLLALAFHGLSRSGKKLQEEDSPGENKVEDGGVLASNRCNVFCKGWRIYFSHNVKFAGLGLASLYMTVLGFDSITTGFAYSQGVNESLIGILTAVGACFGILGSLSFPALRRKIGKNATGIFGFASETLFLLLCVASVFGPGSPWKPEAFLDRFENISGAPINSTASYNGGHGLSLKQIWKKESHVILLMIGIVMARYGLWIADLSVTQIFQEEIAESERGLVNGVQDSMNKGMDLLKFAMVICLPSPATFGFLIFVSWIFVLLGTIFFVVFAAQDRTRKRRLENSPGNTSTTGSTEIARNSEGTTKIPMRPISGCIDSPS